MCMEPVSQIPPPVPEELSESLSTVPLGLRVEPSCVISTNLDTLSNVVNLQHWEIWKTQPIDNIDLKNLLIVAMLKTTEVTI